MCYSSKKMNYSKDHLLALRPHSQGKTFYALIYTRSEGYLKQTVSNTGNVSNLTTLYRKYKLTWMFFVLISGISYLINTIWWIFLIIY